MRGLVVVLLALSHPAWADRAAAEQLVVDAEKSGEPAGYVACGQAFLDLYNQDPTAPDNDEVVFNAARCFEAGKSITAALSADGIVIKSYPRSRLVAKSVAHSAAMYEQIAFYDRAADHYETYAKLYAGEKDAGDALERAIRLRAALGDSAKQNSDTKYFIKTFGTKQPRRAAEAWFALLPTVTGDEAIMLLKSYLAQYGSVDAERTLRVHVELADRLRAKSCPVKAIDGLCVKLVADHGPHCGPAGSNMVTVIRSGDNRLALDEYRKAIEMFQKTPTQVTRHFEAMAKLALADDDLERMLAAKFPTDLDFSMKDEAERNRSLERFDTWIDNEKKLGGKIVDEYSAILASKDAVSSVASALRIGQASLGFANALSLGEIPNAMRSKPLHDAYCDQLNTLVEPLRRRAADVFLTCAAKANELDAGQDWAAACWREGATLDAVLFAAPHELRGTIDAFAPPIAIEPALTPPQPSNTKWLPPPSGPPA